GASVRKRTSFTTRALRPALRHLIILAGLVALIYPLIWMFFSSFKPSVEILSSSGLLPGESFTTENYRTGWRGVGSETFATFFLNSFVIAGLAVVGNILACSLAAYAFAKLAFPLRTVLFAI